MIVNLIIKAVAAISALGVGLRELLISTAATESGVLVSRREFRGVVHLLWNTLNDAYDHPRTKMRYALFAASKSR